MIFFQLVALLHFACLGIPIRGNGVRFPIVPISGFRPIPELRRGYKLESHPGNGQFGYKVLIIWLKGFRDLMIFLHRTTGSRPINKIHGNKLSKALDV